MKPAILLVYISNRWTVILDAFNRATTSTARSMIAITLAAAGIGLEANPSNAQPQYGTMTLHGDEYFSCYVVDDGPGVKSVYVTHRVLAATASRFRVQPGYSS